MGRSDLVHTLLPATTTTLQIGNQDLSGQSVRIRSALFFELRPDQIENVLGHDLVAIAVRMNAVRLHQIRIAINVHNRNGIRGNLYFLANSGNIAVNGLTYSGP